MRIYFVGSHATGKTTLCRYVSRRYGLPMISEVARAVLAEMEMSLDSLRTDIDLTAEYQRRVFARQIAVERMKLKRLSLYYVVAYLGLGGIGLLADPELALRLLGSTGSYTPIMVRTVGTFMVALSAIVLQIARHGNDPLWRSTVLVRCFFLACFAWLYVASGDPLFVTIIAIVGLGMLLTIVAYLRARENPFALRGL